MKPENPDRLKASEMRVKSPCSPNALFVLIVGGDVAIIDVTVVLLEGGLPSTSPVPLEIFACAGSLSVADAAVGGGRNELSRSAHTDDRHRLSHSQRAATFPGTGAVT